MKEDVPNSSVDDVCSMIDELTAFCVLGCNFHEFFEDWIVSVVVIFELVVVTLDRLGYPFDLHEPIN